MSHQKGILSIVRKNAPKSWTQDFYHFLLLLSWPKTLLLFFSIFLATNIIFASLYSLDPSGLHNSEGNFLDYFFFSVQTLGTIGYGYLAPKSNYVNSLVVVEASLGLVMIALLTGFFFAKFSLPKARLCFSEKLLFTTYNKKPVLIFRAANARENSIVSSTLHFTMLKDEKNEEGLSMKKMHDLKLVRSTTPIFSMSITAIHEINEFSPMFGRSFNDIKLENLEFLVTIVGTDGTYGQTIHSSYFYHSFDVHEGGRFADIVTTYPDGTRELNFEPFNNIIDT